MNIRKSGFKLDHEHSKIKTLNVKSVLHVITQFQSFSGKYENLCSFKIHHSGLFMKNRGVTYEYGAIDYYDYVDMDVFSIHELADMVRELDNQHSEPISFQFHIPGTQLDVGLLPLLTDGDVHVMSGFVKENKVLDIYVEHRQSTVNQILQDAMNQNLGKQIQMIMGVNMATIYYMIRTTSWMNRKLTCQTL